MSISGRRSVAAAAVVVVVAAALVVWLVSRPGHTAAAPARPTLTATPHPSPSPTPSPTPTGPPQEAVAQATPTAFRISGPAFTIDAHVCAMPWAFVIDPPGEQRHTVCWVENKIGQPPGSSSTTSYLFGHSWAEDRLEVLNDLSAAATTEILAAQPQLMSGRKIYPVPGLDGYTITLWTSAGVLTYTVSQVFGVAKADWGYLQQVHDDTIAHRVVLTTCAELQGRDYDYNIVVEAYLSSSVAVGSPQDTVAPAANPSADPAAT